jgi:hypothetical protein
MLISVFFFAAVGAASTAFPENPISKAEEGKMQCYRPDVEKKTCQSIASYQRTGPEAYDNKALISLSANVTLEMHTPVIIKSGSVCGFVKAQDVLDGTLRFNGVPVEAERAKPILEQVAEAMAAITDKEICTEYRMSGNDLAARVSVGGTYQPDHDQTVKWIGPDDGYIVTP